MKVYLAARYSRRLELCRYRQDLAARDITVTSRWLNGSHQIADDGMPLGEDGERRFESGDPAADRLRGAFAREDLEDVLSAMALIAFTEEPRSAAAGTSRGGRHIELGIALGARKDVTVIGPRENLFCWLPEVRRYATWDEYLARTDALTASWRDLWGNR